MPTLSAIATAFAEEMDIGFPFTADAASGSTSVVTDLYDLAHTSYDSNHFLDWWVWFPAEVAINRIRVGTTLVNTTGALTVSRAYSSATETAGLILKPEWHPTRYLVPLVNRALAQAWQWWRAPLSIVANGDSEASAVGGTDSGATASRDTTAADVWEGQASVRVLDSGSGGGYHQYATFEAGAGRPYRVGARVRLTLGNGVIRLMDITNSTTLATQTVTGVGQFHEVEFSGSFPSTCYSAAIRVGTDTVSGDSNWDDVWCMWDGLMRFNGPSWVTEWRTQDHKDAFRLLRSENRLGRDSAQPARSYDLTTANETDYQILNIPSAANPAQFELGRSLTADLRPLIIEAKRSYYSFGALAAGGDTTGCPVELAVKAMKWLWAKEKRRSVEEQKDYYFDYLREQNKGGSKLVSPPPDIGASGLPPAGMRWVRVG